MVLTDKKSTTLCAFKLGVIVHTLVGQKHYKQSYIDESYTHKL